MYRLVLDVNRLAVGEEWQTRSPQHNYASGLYAKAKEMGTSGLHFYFLDSKNSIEQIIFEFSWGVNICESMI